MDYSSIESLEPRWSPARLIAGPLPAEFGATLPSISAEEAQNLVVQLPEIDPLDHGMFPPESGGPFTQGTIQINDPAGLVITGAGTLVLSGSVNFGQSTVSGGTLSLSGGTLSFSGGSFSTVGGTLLSGYPSDFFNVQVPSSPGGVLGGSVTLSIAGTVGTTISVANTFPGAMLPLTVPAEAQIVDGGELDPASINQLSVVGPSPLFGGRIFLRPDFALGS